MRVMAVLIGLVVLAADARAQGLGEAAERERQRQEKIRQGGAPAKVITAEELESNPGRLANDPSIPPAVAAQPVRGGSRRVSASDAKVVAPSSTGSAPSTGSPSSGQGEAYWRGRMSSARSAVTRAEEALERVSREEAIVRNDPDHGHPKVAGLEECRDVNDIKKRSLDAREREIANNAKANCEAVKRYRAANPPPKLGDTDKARAALEKAKQAVVDLEEEARRAGANPGWLR
jgi:hypothetical protein